MELVVGLAVAVLFLAARIAVGPWIGSQAPYAFNFLAVVIACVLAGWRSGLVALAAGQILTLYAVVEPRWAFAVLNLEALLAFLFATVSQLLILAVIAIYQREVRNALAEQEREMDLLSEALREIDHRTKNNYQTVVALLMMQAQRASIPEVRQALQDAADRVNAVSLASEQLALRSEDLGTIRLGDHLCDLCEQIKRGLSHDGVQVKCDVANLNASTEKAIYLSIIVNELVTNALKHAFRNSAGGVIRIGSSVHADGVAIIVEDNGCGISQRPSGSRTGLGTRLVERFVSQVGAVHHVTSSSSGTVHRIVVPSLD
ncbi:MAG TPA: histidine kinase dimerization/phosphoacceptor domain -containing protein [Sphingomicrobium sp.]|nr:histidine kinase dimerization/phosphoacceptor domain -containing protein [Sphingomicrobium sp.]